MLSISRSRKLCNPILPHGTALSDAATQTVAAALMSLFVPVKKPWHSSQAELVRETCDEQPSMIYKPSCAVLTSADVRASFSLAKSIVLMSMESQQGEPRNAQFVNMDVLWIGLTAEQLSYVSALIRSHKADLYLHGSIISPTVQSRAELLQLALHFS